MKRRYISLSAEQAPWSRSGGLAEVAGSLPEALALHWREHRDHNSGEEVTTECISVSPLYPCVWREVARRGARLLPGQTLSLEPVSDSSAQLWTLDGAEGGEHSEVTHVFVDLPWAFDRPQLYGPPGQSYPDNPARFASFCLAVLRWIDLIGEDTTGEETIVHCHDWQSAFLPIFHQRGWGNSQIKTLFTIHNLQHQGRCEAYWVTKLGLSWSDFHMNYLEHWGQMNPLKAALLSVDEVTTVSPSYAEEVTTSAFSCGLDAFLRANDIQITGILNGLDVEAWSPHSSAHLSAHLPPSPSDQELVAWKRALKTEVAPRLYPIPQEGENESKNENESESKVLGAPLAVLISRLDQQKGIDLLINSAVTWLDQGGKLFILGSGDPKLEVAVLTLATRYPHRCEVKIGFHLGLAHQLFAAADLCLIPSKFEPCGLTQMQSMRYGALPLATPVGGLRDTISTLNREGLLHDETRGNGFLSSEVSASALSQTLESAYTLWSDQAGWAAARRRALNTSWSWQESAKSWSDLISRLSSKEKRVERLK